MRAKSRVQNLQCLQAGGIDLHDTIYFENGLSLVPVTGENVLVFIIQVKKLAEYEKLLDIVEMNEDLVKKVFLTEGTNVKGYVAYYEGKPVGFTIYFYNFSSFKCRKGLYLEDLYIDPEYRGKGFGKTILKHLAAVAVSEGCGRFEWAVLDWNTPAINFYKSLGAVPMDEWTIFRVEGEALHKLAEQ